MFVLAADRPDQPLRPSLIEATDNSITVQLYPSPNANGAPIQHYELLISTDGLSYSPVSNYDGQAMTYELTYQSEGIITGTIYYISLAAHNVKGVSISSENLLAACSSPPAQAATP